MDYFLLMTETDGSPAQHVLLTREEFVSLKRSVAKMRGFEASEELDTPPEGFMK